MNQFSFEKSLEGLTPAQQGKVEKMAANMTDDQREQFFADLSEAGSGDEASFAKENEALDHLQVLVDQSDRLVRPVEHQQKLKEEKAEQEKGLEDISSRIDKA